jgi:hypothetical protein
MAWRFMVGAGVLAMFGVAAAQIRLPGGVRLPSISGALESAVKRPAPITTSLNDGDPGLWMLDGFEPDEEQAPLDTQPFVQGAWLAQPGF